MLTHFNYNFQLPKPKLQEPEPDLSDDDEPNLIPRIKAELIKIEPGTLPPLEADSIKIETESMKIEPMDFDWNDVSNAMHISYSPFFIF